MINDEKKKCSFDVYQRFKGISDVLAKLCMNKQNKILDVGGYPCAMADFLKPLNVIVTDIPDCARENYVKGSGLALPFSDNSFDAVISSDTLEHIPENDKTAFLSEMYRVSSEYIILGAPFADNNVEFCENNIAEFYQNIEKKPHPWLDEHINHTLPILLTTTEFFIQKKCSAAIIPNGNLFSWFILEYLENISRVLSVENIFREAMPLINSLELGTSNNLPVYRYIAVFSKKEMPLKDIFKGQCIDINETNNEDYSLILKKIAEVFEELYSAIKDKNTGYSATAEELTAIALSNIQKTINSQNEELKQKEIQLLKAKLARIENNPVYKIFRRIFK